MKLEFFKQTFQPTFIPGPRPAPVDGSIGFIEGKIADDSKSFSYGSGFNTPQGEIWFQQGDKTKYPRNLRNNSAFCHVILTRVNGRNIIFVTAAQKKLKRTESKRNYKLSKSNPDLRISLNTHSDPHQMSQGATRHLLFFDALLRIAQKLQNKGISAEVHVPKAESVRFLGTANPSFFLKPYQLLDKHFEQDEIQIGDKTLVTINLNKPKSTEGREAIEKVSSGF